jgi:hypothetical protein
MNLPSAHGRENDPPGSTPVTTSRQQGWHADCIVIWVTASAAG